MLTGEKYSLLISTFNRPAMLGALLEYLANKKVQFPIFILDSSSNENKAQNREVADRYGLHVRHLDFNEDARFDFKIGTALREVDSDYVSLCADDDIVFIEAIEECVDELDRDAELVACHGVYLNFDVNQAEVHLRIEYASPSIDSDNVVDRTCQLLIRYEALNYAVYRRSVMSKIIDAVSHAPADMFWELFSCLVPLVDGKVKRVSRLYHGRRSNGATGRKIFDPVSWIAEDPDAFARAFLEYRERLFRYYAANGVNVDPDARKALTQAHVIYLCRELRDGAGIKRALAGTSSPLARIDAVPNKTPNIQFLPRDTRVGSKVRIIQLLAPDAWLGSKIRKMIARGDVINFTSHGINFKLSHEVQGMLTDEITVDLSRYIQTSDRL